MKLSRVEASSMQEALVKIRSTLGEGARIVGTRTFRRGGLLGVCAREMVEVYVADERSEKPPRDSLSRTRPGVTEIARNRLAEKNQDRQKVEHLARVVGSLRDEIRELVVKQKDGEFEHPFLREAYQDLILHDVDPGFAQKLVWELKSKALPMGSVDPGRVRRVMKAQLSRAFLPNVPTGLNSENRVIVLVGPTGVGKTTTIAKLAARAKINEGKNVGLVTLDTFRIAAVDQLSKYAEIIGVGLEVVSDPVEFQASVKKLIGAGADVVLVDSAGRGQRDELKLGELGEFLSVIQEAEIHLVLSTTSHPRTIRSVARRFSSIGFHRVILTKLDETESFGSLVAALSTIVKPVSFLTDGQHVPEDIMVSDPDRLAELVFRAGENQEIR